MSAIQITYSTRVEIDLEEVCENLEIRMEHIKTITTTGNVLDILMKDGSELQYEFDSSLLEDSEMDDQNPSTKIV